MQSKLSDAMSQVRHDKDFPNPILRLGQDQANFKRLTSTQTLTQVSAYVKASKANQPRIQAELTGKRDELKAQINQTIETLGQLPLSEIARVYAGEQALTELAVHVIPEMQSITDERLLPLLSTVLAASENVEEYFRSAFAALAAGEGLSLMRKVRLDAAVLALAAQVDGAALGLFDRLSADQVRQVGSWLLEFEQLRMPVFGYLFRGKALRKIERSLTSQLSTRTAPSS